MKKVIKMFGGYGGNIIKGLKKGYKKLILIITIIISKN